MGSAWCWPSTLPARITTSSSPAAIRSAPQLPPIRVNAIHPGIVGDSPYWSAKPAQVLEGVRAKTPAGRLATMRDIVDAAVFLLTNPAVNGVDLAVDGGWHFMTW